MWFVVKKSQSLQDKIHILCPAADDLVKVDTPDFLSEDEYREFWIAFDHDEVRVGKGNEWEPFMQAAIPESFAVTHFGYSTGWGAAGWWQFHSKTKSYFFFLIEFIFAVFSFEKEKMTK